ncbi:MAG: hypothetical protein PUB07_01910 [Clostridia bacterium]|nr:hypothetical protein [Clostridia bacterium]
MKINRYINGKAIKTMPAEALELPQVQAAIHMANRRMKEESEKA